MIRKHEAPQTRAGSRRTIATALLMCAAMLVASCTSDPTVMKSARYDDVKVEVMRRVSVRDQTEPKIAHVNIKNGTSEQIRLGDLMAAELESRGYRIVDNPGDANYLLTINVRAVGGVDAIYKEYGWLPRHSGGVGHAGGTAGAVGATLGGIGTFGAVIAGIAGTVADKEIHNSMRAQGYAMVVDVSVDVRKDSEKKGEATRVMTTTENTSAGLVDAKRRLEEETALAIVRML